jgi:hypothetical protein
MCDNTIKKKYFASQYCIKTCFLVPQSWLLIHSSLQISPWKKEKKNRPMFRSNPNNLRTMRGAQVQGFKIQTPALLEKNI